MSVPVNVTQHWATVSVPVNDTQHWATVSVPVNDTQHWAESEQEASPQLQLTRSQV